MNIERVLQRLADQPRATALVDGLPADTVALDDRALAYGDGLFETLLARPGLLPAWPLHEQRLLQGLQQLQFPPLDLSELPAQALALLQQHGQGLIKIIVTRGSGPRGYATQGCRSRLIVRWLPWQAAQFSNHAGVEISLAKFRLAQQAQLAGIKHLNRLENVLARNEQLNQSIAEVLLRDSGGSIIEGSMTNVILQHGQFETGTAQFSTADLAQCGVNGIMRQRFALWLQQSYQLQLQQQPLTMKQLCSATGVYLSNSVIGIWPVRRVFIGQRLHQYSIGNWQTEFMQHLQLQDGIQRHCEPCN